MDNVVAMQDHRRGSDTRDATVRQRERVVELLHGRVPAERIAKALARYDNNIRAGLGPDLARSRVVKWALYALD